MYAYFADTLAKLEYKGVFILWKVAPVQTGSPAEHRSWAWVPFSKNLFALTMNAKCSLDKAGRWGNEVTIFILLKQLLPVLLYKFKNIQLVNSGALLLSWLSPPHQTMSIAGGIWALKCHSTLKFFTELPE